MNTFNKDFFINHGFQEDTDKKVLFRLFTEYSKFKEVNISVNLTEPCMLLARSKEKNVSVEVNTIQENRLILKRKLSREKFDTVIMNILPQFFILSQTALNPYKIRHCSSWVFSNSLIFWYTLMAKCRKNVVKIVVVS